jgi:hypothetical protein
MRSSAKFLAVGLVAVTVVLDWAPSALAHPTGEYEPFGECPYANPIVEDCVLGTFAGSLDLGAQTIALTNPITLQGGSAGAPPETVVYGASSGATLSKTPQTVPSGLFKGSPPPSWPPALQEQFEEVVEEGLTGVYATIELAGPSKGKTTIQLDSENLLFEEGTALSLPVRIKLGNPFLGSECFIGSFSEPIQLRLTTGESNGLSGSAGTWLFNEEFTIVTIKKLKLVDGTFSVLGATGCGGEAFAEYVDPLVDSFFGLPSPVFENGVELKGVLRDASAEAVAASDP